jgi:hypothetical protein
LLTDAARSVVAPALEIDPRRGDMTVERKFRWDLFSRGQTFPESTAAVSNLAARAARAKFFQRKAAWTLPGSPWTLLMLMGASADNRLEGERWTIPVHIPTRAGDEMIGYDIVVGLPRPFPGTIPPLGDPGPVPKMAAAP